jgi:hypothetical protein
MSHLTFHSKPRNKINKTEQSENSKDPNSFKTAKQQKRLIQQHIINQTNISENLPFGDDISKDDHFEGFIFHNVNGLKNEHNWFQILQTMQDLNTSFFGLVETNTTMHGYYYHKWNKSIRKIFKVSKTATSKSDIKFDNEYKPGGTISVFTDKWQSRVTEKGQDETGLGRWNYMIISSNKRKLVIITAYKSCKMEGPTTAWAQQWLLLRESNTNPDPVKEFV